jgi:short-chain Z-isoprenyl diphosphate synthase
MFALRDRHRILLGHPPAIIGDVVPPERTGLGVGMLNTAGTWVACSGPLASGALAEAYGYGPGSGLPSVLLGLHRRAARDAARPRDASRPRADSRWLDSACGDRARLPALRAAPGAGLRGQPLPRHVGVILDGNRRFARAKGPGQRREGHRVGAEKIHELLDWCHELGISYVTLWLLSTENLQRDTEEVGTLCSSSGPIEQIAYAPATRARACGSPPSAPSTRCPTSLRRTLKEAEEATATGTGCTCRWRSATGVAGRSPTPARLLEERQAGATAREVIADLTPEDITEHLYTTGTPDPDLIIRTSGEIRLSGFLLWQSAHSEFYFCDPYWPEFRKTDFLRALREFASRQRRYGR